MKHNRIIATIICTVVFVCGCGKTGIEAMPEKAIQSSKNISENPNAEDISDKAEVRDNFPDKTMMSLSDASDDNGTYTIMIYMIGSDLETKNKAASIDLVEMMNSGVDPSKVNVIVYTGGAKNWWIGIPSTKNTILKLAEDNGTIGFEMLGETICKDMTKPETLAEFLEFVYRNYKTEHYALICWDHGAGPVFGYGYDENFEENTMLIPEIDEAINNSPFGENNKLEWIGYDACLMSCIEVANVLQKYANYLIASQETEPGMGWDYSFLAVLNETSNSRKIAKAIIDTYISSYDSYISPTFNPDLTMACMDLSKTDQVNKCIDIMFEKMFDSLEQGEHRKLSNERAKSKAYGLSAVSNRGDAPDVIDLGSFAIESADSYPDESKKLVESIDKFVIYEKSNAVNTSGISVYYPYYNKEVYEYGGSKLYNLISVSENYSKYIEAYTREWGLSERRDDVKKSVATNQRMILPEGDDKYICVPLTEDKMENFADAYYSIFLDTGDIWYGTEGTYIPVLTECTIIPDENGVMKIPADPEIIISTAGDILCWAREIENDSNGLEYQLKDATLTAGSMPYVDFVKVRARLSGQADKKELIIKGFEQDNEDVKVSARNTISSEEYTSFARTFYTYLPEYDSEGDILPYNLWERGKTVLHIKGNIDNEFGFKKYHLSEVTELGRFVYQIIIEDKAGNQYATPLNDFDIAADFENVTVNTKNGSVDCRVYDDHAVIVRYNGTGAHDDNSIMGEECVELPNNVKGIPVTEVLENSFGSAQKYLRNTKKVVFPASVTKIGNNIFAYCSSIEEIVLPGELEVIPEGLYKQSFSKEPAEIILPEKTKIISSFAFNGAKVSSIRIPATVESIMPGAFAGCQELNSIEVDEKNVNYKSVDGVLFSKDGKKLIACTGLERSKYSIPNGVEEICNYAFYGSYSPSLVKDDPLFEETGLVEITIPESVKRIGIMAFSDCTGFDRIIIPDSVESIGAFAFGRYWATDMMGKTDIQLGSGLKQIGYHAFTSYEAKKITISNENPFFGAKDGKIYSKSGERLVAAFNADRNEDYVMTEHMEKQ